MRRKPQSHRIGGEQKRKCFNCGCEKHLFRSCSQPVNFSRADASCVRHLRGKTYRAQLICFSLSVPEPNESDEQGDTDLEEDANVSTFEELLVEDVNRFNYDTNSKEATINWRRSRSNRCKHTLLQLLMNFWALVLTVEHNAR